MSDIACGWDTVDVCWDSTLDPCTLSSGRIVFDTATWAENYGSSQTTDLVPSEASTANRVLQESSRSAETSTPQTTSASDKVECPPFEAKEISSPHDSLFQLCHGKEDGVSSFLPKARRRRRKAKHTFQGSWELHRATIRRLYLDEEKCLEEVVQYMEKHFGFVERIPAYKRMLSHWGLFKNIPASHMRVLAAKARKRKVYEGKDTQFYVHGRLLDPSKLIRFNGRRPATSKDDLTSGDSTPPYVRYNTPPLASSPSLQLLSNREENYGSPDNDSSMVQTPESLELNYFLAQDCLQNSLDNDLLISATGSSDYVQENAVVPRHAVYAAEWKSYLDDSFATKPVQDVIDGSVLVNNLALQSEVEHFISPLVPRLPCGIFKPPMKLDAIMQQVPTKALLDEASILDKEPSRRLRRDSMPQGCDRLSSTVYLNDHLSRHQQEYLSTTVAVLEKARSMILCQNGTKDEIFLQQSLVLGLIYEELLIPSKCNEIIADLTNGYSKFWCPVEDAKWTDEDRGNFTLPISDYHCCVEPVSDHCTCDQLREFAIRNRARMSSRAYNTLQSRAIACYLRSSRIDQALNSLLDLEDIFSPLAVGAYIQSVLEILESYPVDSLNCNRLLPFMQRAISSGKNILSGDRTQRVSCRLWTARRITLEAHLSLITGCIDHESHPQASKVWSTTEDQLLQQIGSSDGNGFRIQMQIMRDVQTLTKHYRDQGGLDAAGAFVLRIWEKCKDSWGLYNSETLQALDLMRALTMDGQQQTCPESDLYDWAMVFDGFLI